ncbi:MAG: single-stranded DNA-binding protein [Ilumatobacteraceae bacterium]|nr:single-stranded DNA-binding protein [Ilumatobacteraceae bacterium]
MNDVTISGRLGTDLVLRFTDTATPVTNVRLAVHRPGHDDPDWFSVAVWGKAAQNLVEHCAKGDRVVLFGHLRPDTVTGADGKKYDAVTVHADRVEFASSKREVPA